MHRNQGTFLVIAFACGALAAQANLLDNPGFESEFADERNPRWGTFSRENWPNGQPEGDYAGYIKADWSGASDKAGGAIQSVPAQPGVEYVLSAQAYFDNGFKADSKVLKLEFFDSSNNMLDSVTDDLSGLKLGQWVRVTMTGKSPPETAKAQVVFEASGVDDSGVLGIDNLDLRAATP